MISFAWNIAERGWDRITIVAVPVVSGIFVAIGWILFFITLTLAPFLRYPLKLLRFVRWFGEPLVRSIIASM